MENKLENNGNATLLEPLDEGGFFVEATGDSDATLSERISELELECAEHVQRVRSMREKLVRAEVGRCAALMGVPSERISHVSKLVNLDSVLVEGGEPDTASEVIEAAVAAVLMDIPELGSARTGGAFNPKMAPAGKADTYRRQIDDANAKGDILAAISLKRKARKLGLSV